MVFSQVLVPAVSQQFGRGDIDRIREIYLTSARFLMMAGIPLAVGGVILSGSIITLFYGSDYAPTIQLMQIMFIPFAVVGIADAAVGIIYGMNQPSFIFKMGLGLVVLSIGLNLWLIREYGVIGAAIGSSIPRLIAPIFYILFASKQCGVSWPYSDALKIIGSSVIMGAVIFGLKYFIDSPLLNLLILIPLGLLVQIFSLIMLKVIREKDIITFKRVQGGLPSGLQRIFGSILSPIESLVNWRNRTSGAQG
jgi:O-antigen/teichoic acid export membrane protein